MNILKPFKVIGKGITTASIATTDLLRGSTIALTESITDNAIITGIKSATDKGKSARLKAREARVIKKLEKLQMEQQKLEALSGNDSEY